MRFVLVSTHTDQTTGYAKVAHNLLRQLATLAPKVKTYHFGFQRHPSRPGFRKAPEGIVQYDAAANEDPKEEGFGFNKINEYLEMVGPDVVMIYNDPLIIYKFIEAMKHERGKASYKLWIYVDQVYHGIAQPLMDSIREHADRVFAFSPYWKAALQNYGDFPNTGILEHAVDPSVFTAMSAPDRSAIRTNMNLPQNAIVYLNANRNSQRKRLDLTIQGFVRLLKRETNRPYYLIIASNLSAQGGAYYDASRIYSTELAAAGLNPQTYAPRLMLIDTAPPNVLADEGINQLYNIADVGINTSDGEGYGLCQLEHLYTGAPQVVTDIGTYRDFLDESVAQFVQPEFNVYFAGGMPLGGYVPVFHPEKVADALEAIAGKLPEMRETIKNYNFKSWSRVCDAWLEEILTLTG
jgi:glycosyltransferase involved in cell wall biosynthesis